MHKKIIGLLLCVFVMMSMAAPVHAVESDSADEVVEEVVLRELTIATAEEFLAFAENCRLDTYSQNLSVTLSKDIDLSGCDFTCIPIFSGIFDGKGHSITGLSITGDGSVQGLFRYLTGTAVVQNLTVSGIIQPGGSKNEIGAIAGHNEGKIDHCTFTGTLSGNDYVGGIAGTNAVTGIIEHCRAQGSIHGNHFVGGIAGENSGVIRNCDNTALINTTPQQNSVELSDITLETLTNTENVNTVTDIGGIAGISSGVIRNCENRADVGYRQMGYNIGGIAGTQTGYIVECENFANVQGRKEVGGIVGQMEPVSLIEYTEDALQILEEQLDTMSGLVNQAAGNAQANAGSITTQLGELQDQAETARDAVDALFPDEENPQLPDADAIIAAQNTLITTLDAMPETLRSIASATQTTIYNLNRDLNAISGQIGAMSQTLDKASENLGGTITDSSDLDTPELLSAKVEACVNHGSVLAEINVGGIAGTMAIENDMDTFDDWMTDGDSSLNFQAEVRAVILDCQNSGTVTGTKQNVGGITGWQSLGLVKNCGNTGIIDAENATYAGGISGMSSGYIRSDYAKCEIHGKSYVGGIAGSGTIVTDSLAQVKLINAKEKLGGILGYAEDPAIEIEDPISENRYLRMDTDYGAIDGISYSGLAEGIDLDAFLALDAAPEMFRNVTVRFLFADGTEKRIEIHPGDSLSDNQIPEIPEKSGCTAAWDGLAGTDLHNITFDLSFEAVYASYRSTIQSQQLRDNGLPAVLAEGAFMDDAVISLVESDAVPVTTETGTYLEGWVIDVPVGTEQIRLLSPDGVNADNLKLLVQQADGTWSSTAFTQDGRYLVFRAEAGTMDVVLMQAQRNHALWIGAGICVLLVAAIVVTVCVRKQRSKKAVSQPNET